MASGAKWTVRRPNPTAFRFGHQYAVQSVYFLASDTSLYQSTSHHLLWALCGEAAASFSGGPSSPNQSPTPQSASSECKASGWGLVLASPGRVLHLVLGMHLGRYRVPEARGIVLRARFAAPKCFA